jgi:hypothetical protein
MRHGGNQIGSPRLLTGFALTPAGMAFAAAVFGALLAVVPSLKATAEGPAYYEMPEYQGTTSRIDMEARAAILGPADGKFWQGKDIGGGLCAYEALIASRTREHGESSLQVADTRAYFGAEIAGAGYYEHSLPFMEAGLADYRKVFGPDSPEVAIVLMDLASSRVEAFGDAQLDTAIAEAVQAHAILLKAKGERNQETALALTLVARLKGRPAYTQGDAGRIAASGALFAEAARTYPLTPYKPVDADRIYERWAKMLIANGRTEEALEILEPTRTLYNHPSLIFYLVCALRDDGQVPAARAVAKRFGQGDIDMTPQPSWRDPLPPWPRDLKSCPPERRAEFGL